MDKREQGQSLVEFALSLAVLILILLAIFDLGRAFNAYIIVANAAREGAYYAGTHPPVDAASIDAIRAHAVQEAQGSGITITAADVTVSSSFTSGTPISVTVGYTFSLFSSVVPGISTIRLQSSAEMVIY